MKKGAYLSIFLLGLIAFLLPIEHRYDKFFRFYSHTLIPEGLFVSKQYDKNIYFYISDLLTIFLTFWGFFYFRFSFKKWIQNPLWLVFFFSLVSVFFSPFSHYPIAYFRLLQLFTPIALFSFITQMEEKQKITHTILLCLLAASFFQAVIGIAQYFHQAPLGLRLLGEAKEFDVFSIAKKTRWLFDDLTGHVQQSSIIFRSSGTLSHTNIFGGLMFVSLLISYFFALSYRLFLLLIPLLLFGLTVSFSRSAFFAWVLATMLFFLLNTMKEGFQRLTPLFFTLFFSSMTIFFLFQDQLRARGGVLINSSPLIQTSDGVRKTLQIKGFKVIQDHPFFGVGWSQFSESTRAYFDQDKEHFAKVTAPHNIFLFLACETGLFSLFFLIFFLAQTAHKALFSSWTKETILFFSLLTGMIFIGFCDFYPILFHQGRLLLFFCLALLVANTQRNVVKVSPSL